MRVTCFLLLILLGGCMTPRTADDDICKTYNASAGAPSEVGEILALDRAGAVRICIPNSSDPSDKRYGLLSAVGRGPLQTCQYLQRPVFKHVRTNNHFEWSFDPVTDAGTYSYAGSSQFMALPEDMCPPHSDRKYVGVNGVSEDVFLRIARAWERVMDSPAALDKALSSADATQSDNQALRRWHSKKAQRDSKLPYSISLDVRAAAMGLLYAYEISLADEEHQSIVVSGTLEQDEFVISRIGIAIN